MMDNHKNGDSGDSSDIYSLSDCESISAEMVADNNVVREVLTSAKVKKSSFPDLSHMPRATLQREPEPGFHPHASDLQR